jgi:peptide/nickel transport system substrate-binding protein
MDGKTSPRKGLLGLLSRVEVIDDHTVRFETEKPWAILPLMLSLQEILPMKYMKAVGPHGFQANPVGAGPFKFVKKEGEERLILERFENYYGGSPENPPVQTAPLKNLVFKIVSEKIDRIAMLNRGDCDIITHVSPEAVGILKMIPDIQVLSHRATRSYFAEMNCTKAPFNDRRIRLAMNYAVDMQAVVDHILQGHGQVLPTVLLPNAFAHDDSLKPYPYDIKLAQKLLTDTGLPEELSIQISCSEGNRQFANIIALFIQKLGVGSVIQEVSRERLKALGRISKWDIFVDSWGNSTLDPMGILVPKFKSDGRGNYSGYNNEKVDQLFSLAEGTLDLHGREKYYKEVQGIIYRDVHMIFGYAAEEFYGVRERVKNFIPSSSGMMNMHDVYVQKGD